MGLKHFFHSVKADPADPTIIGATKWNDDHYYVDGAGAPVGNVGAVLLAGAAGALTHLNSVAAGSVLTSAGVGALPIWSAPAGGVPAALVADSLTLSLAAPDVVLSRSAANKLLLGGAGFSMLQFGGTTAAFPALKCVANRLDVKVADDSGWAELFVGSIIPTSGSITMGFGGQRVAVGDGAPEGAVAAAVGSLWLRKDGGAGTTLYIKETGAATNTGWVAK